HHHGGVWLGYWGYPYGYGLGYGYYPGYATAPDYYGDYYVDPRPPVVLASGATPDSTPTAMYYAPQADNPARLRGDLPADAARTPQPGADRVFSSPPLVPGTA